MTAAVRDALVVAVAEYSDPKLGRLRAPAVDAERLAGVLGDPSIGDFTVEVASDVSEGPLRRLLGQFFDNRRSEDLLLVHFSCHGVKDERGELYLAAADTESNRLSSTAVASSWLNNEIDRCRSKRIVVLLDCCFSGSFASGLRPRAGEQVNLQDHLGGRGRALITASNSMEYSYEGDELAGVGKPSIFTGAVVEALATGKADRDGDRRISVDELYDYVYDRVREQTPNQSPTKLSNLEGPLYIARSTYQSTVQPATIPPELLDRTGNPLARARLQELADLLQCSEASEASVQQAARLALEAMADDHGPSAAGEAEQALAAAQGTKGTPEPARMPASDLRASQRSADQPVRPSPSQTFDVETLLSSFGRSPNFPGARHLCAISHVAPRNSRFGRGITYGRPSRINAVAFGPDGQRIATGGEDATARVWGADTGREVTRVTHQKRVTGVAFSPDGRQIATASEDATARVWDADTGREVTRVTHQKRVTGVAFSPDGRQIATASYDGTARVWDVGSGTRRTCVTTTFQLDGVAFSPDGRQIATAGSGPTSVWDAASGRQLNRLEGSPRYDLDSCAVAVVFSPDGRQIATADRRLHLWELLTTKPSPRTTMMRSLRP